MVILFPLISCSTIHKANSEQFNPQEVREVTKATSYTDLIIVDSLGVTGADGAISFPLSEDYSIFMMGDSFLSPVKNKKRDVNSTMINNTFILINKKKGIHKALYNQNSAVADSFLKPTYGDPKEYYWPGHGFQKNGIIHVFMSRFLHGDYDWGFKFSGTDYIRMDKNTIFQHQQCTLWTFHIGRR